MTKTKLMTALLAAVMMTAVVGCASTAKTEGTGEYVDDTWITTKVKSVILEEPSLKSAEINVETFKGVVQLSGFVKQKEDVAKATSVTRTVKGVKDVKNSLILK